MKRSIALIIFFCFFLLNPVVLCGASAGAAYMCIDLTTGAVTYQDTAPTLTLEEGTDEEMDRTAGGKARDRQMWFRKVSAGSYMMGAPEGEIGAPGYELQHKVTLTEAFYIGVFEVTQRQWMRVMGYNPSTIVSNHNPVENVSYDMIRGKDLPGGGWPEGGHEVAEDSFVGRLRSMTQLELDLPTDGQWERACRAGTTTALNSGKDLTDLTDDGQSNNAGAVARYKYTANGQGHAVVGSYKKNSWGIYDMHGNVSEWCLDWATFTLDNQTDPVGMSTKEAQRGGTPVRTLRGGGWLSLAQDCRSASKQGVASDFQGNAIGFRLACSVKAPASRKLSSLVIEGPDEIPPCSYQQYICRAVYSDGTTAAVMPRWEIADAGEFNGVSYGNMWWTGMAFNGAPPTDMPMSLTCTYGVGGRTLTVSRKVTLKAQSGLAEKAYMVIDLAASSPAQAISYRSKGPDVKSDVPRSTQLWLRKIPAGTILLGSPEGELGRGKEKKNGSGTVPGFAETLHAVTISKPFYISVYELSQGQWAKITGTKPVCSYMGESWQVRAADKMSYATLRGSSIGAGWPGNGHEVDASSLLGKLRQKTGLMFDLPTEAQWEYACRGGTDTALNSGAALMGAVSSNNMEYLARYYYTEQDTIGCFYNFTRSGCYAPNAWGLYDMHGNVREWCLDWGGPYPEGSTVDPVGALSGTVRIVRGGVASSEAWECRSACRLGANPASPSIAGEDLYDASNTNFGFGCRLVCPIDETLAVVPSKTGEGPSIGDERSLTISSNAEWTVSCDESWIELDQASGKDNGEVTVRCMANNGPGRHAVVTVRTDGGLVEEIEIKQSGRKLLAMKLNGPERIEVAGQAEYICQATFDNGLTECVPVEWTVDGVPEGTQEIYLLVNGNMGNEDQVQHLAAIFSEDGVTTKAETDVTLVMRPLLAVEPTVFERFNAAAHPELQLSIETLDTWHITGIPEWLTVECVEGEGNAEVTLSVAVNRGAARSVVLSVVSGAGRIIELTVSQDARVLDHLIINGSNAIPFDGQVTYSCTAVYDNGETETVVPVWTLDGMRMNGTVKNGNMMDMDQQRTLMASFTDGQVTRTVALGLTLLMRPSLAVSPAGITGLTAAAQTVSNIVVLTTDTWKITGIPEWIELDAAEGMGETGICMTVAANGKQARSAKLTVTSGFGRTYVMTVSQNAQKLDHLVINGLDEIPVGGSETYTCTAWYDNGENKDVVPTWTLDGKSSNGTVVNDNDTAEHQYRLLKATYRDGVVTVSSERTVTLRRPQVFEIICRRGWNPFVITLDLTELARTELLEQLLWRYDGAEKGFVRVTDKADLAPGAVLWMHSGRNVTLAYRADEPVGPIHEDDPVPESVDSWVLRGYVQEKTLPGTIPLTVWRWDESGTWVRSEGNTLEAAAVYWIYRK